MICIMQAVNLIYAVQVYDVYICTVQPRRGMLRAQLQRYVIHKETRSLDMICNATFPPLGDIVQALMIAAQDDGFVRPYRKCATSIFGHRASSGLNAVAIRRRKIAITQSATRNR